MRKLKAGLPTLRYDGSHPITLEATILLVQAEETAAVVGDRDVAGMALNFPLRPSSGTAYQKARDPFVIGANRGLKTNSISNWFAGTIDELRISKVARYTNDFTPQSRFEPDADTMALYHFDEGTGDILADSSGNGHHGKIVNAKWVPGIAGAQP